VTEAELAIVEEVRAASDAFVSLCRTLETELGSLSVTLSDMSNAFDRACRAVERTAEAIAYEHR
jgi:hypothetical protein